MLRGLVMRLFVLPSLALAASLLVGCSSNDGTRPPAVDASTDVDHPEAGPARDAQPDAPRDAEPDANDGGIDAPIDAPLDAPSDVIHPSNVTAAQSYPQVTVVDPAGAVLTAPKIVTVTFAAIDATQRAHLEQFGDTIATTPWWSAVTDGYCAPLGHCIGQGVSGGHVTLSETAAATYDDVVDITKPSTLRTFIADHIASGAFPAPTEQTVYMLYFPSTTSFTFEGMASCSQTGFNAYHSYMDITAAGPTDAGAPMHIQYAVMPDCGAGADVTNVASHELVEAATDPRPRLHPTFVMQDPGWVILYKGNNELADLCLGATTTESGFLVQRSFSGLSGSKGHSSCVPNLAGTWFGAAPAMQTLQLGVGQSQTIDVTGFADGPLGEWTMTADDANALQGGSAYLDFAWDDTTMFAGKTVHLTVTLKAAPPQDELHQGFAAYVVRSHAPDGKTVHIWPAAVMGL
jgi:hypothetical protein